MHNNILLEAFNSNLEGYCNNNAFAGDVHTSINFTQKLVPTTQGRRVSAPLGAGRPWSKVERDIVDTFNDFVREYTRQIDLHLKTYNK